MLFALRFDIFFCQIRLEFGLPCILVIAFCRCTSNSYFPSFSFFMFMSRNCSSLCSFSISIVYISIYWGNQAKPNQTSQSQIGLNFDTLEAQMLVIVNSSQVKTILCVFDWLIDSFRRPTYIHTCFCLDFNSNRSISGSLIYWFFVS